MKTRGGVEDARLEAKAKDTKKIWVQPKDSPSEDRHLEAQDRNARGQGQGPWTQTQVFSKTKTKKGLQNFFQAISKKKKKKVFKIFFQAISTKNGLEKKFSIDLQNFNHLKIVLFLIRVQGNFWGLEAKAKDFKMRTSSRPRTSSRTPPLIKTLTEVNLVR